jgi:hypothetical protein
LNGAALADECKQLLVTATHTALVHALPPDVTAALDNTSGHPNSGARPKPCPCDVNLTNAAERVLARFLIAMSWTTDNGARAVPGCRPQSKARGWRLQAAETAALLMRFDSPSFVSASECALLAERTQHRDAPSLSCVR